MATGANDIGDDIEIGNENHCRQGTTLMLNIGGPGFDLSDDEGGQVHLCFACS